MVSIIITPEQQKIINLTEGKHIVSAPAGSGKTEIAKYRGNVMIHLVCTQHHHQYDEECVDDTKQEISTKVKEKPGEEETI